MLSQFADKLERKGDLDYHEWSAYRILEALDEAPSDIEQLMFLVGVKYPYERGKYVNTINNLLLERAIK